MPIPSTRHSRILGALLGVHAGDSLGAALEFKSHAQIAQSHPFGLHTIVGGGPFAWPPGHATDDTDMTRCVLLAYQDAILSSSSSSSSSPSSAAASDTRTIAYRSAEYFLKWYEGQWPDTSGKKKGTTPKDIGRATSTGIDNFRRSRDPSTSGAGKGRAGNGSLMRCIPTALFQNDHHLLVTESMAISAVTHNDPDCVIACAAYNAVVAALVAGADVQYAVARGEAVAITLEKGRKGPVFEAFTKARDISLPKLAKKGPPEKWFPGLCSGHVLESLTLAIVAVLDDRPFEDVLVDVIRVGRDTDTNGAIAGGLLGARDGDQAIPREWVNVLQFGHEFKEIARNIWAFQERKRE